VSVNNLRCNLRVQTALYSIFETRINIRRVGVIGYSFNVPLAIIPTLSFPLIQNPSDSLTPVPSFKTVIPCTEEVEDFALAVKNGTMIGEVDEDDIVGAKEKALTVHCKSPPSAMW